MKKIAIMLGLAGIVGTAFGQGYVTVAGTQQNKINDTALTTSWTGGLASGGVSLATTTSGSTYYVALLSSTVASPTTSLFGDSTLGTTWLDTGLQGVNSATFAGRMSIGSGLQAANAAIGVSQSWILVAWSANLGSSWSAIESEVAAGQFTSSGYFGWSVVGVGAASAASPATPLIIEGTPNPIISTGFSLMSVSAVPEPCTLALLGLGGLSLLVIRRRK